MLRICATLIFVGQKLSEFYCKLDGKHAIKFLLHQLEYNVLKGKDRELNGESNGRFGFSIYRAHKFVLRIRAILIFGLPETK